MTRRPVILGSALVSCGSVHEDAVLDVGRSSSNARSISGGSPNDEAIHIELGGGGGYNGSRSANSSEFVDALTTPKAKFRLRYVDLKDIVLPVARIHLIVSMECCITITVTSKSILAGYSGLAAGGPPHPTVTLGGAFSAPDSRGASTTDVI